MSDWPGNRLCALLGIRHPIIQAPMAGASTVAMAVAASRAGALGSLGCAMMAPDAVAEAGQGVRAGTNGAFNLNFFCHAPPADDPARTARAVERLSPWYHRLDAGPVVAPVETHVPFGEAECDAVLATGAPVASFHFGLPPARLVDRLKSAGVVILSSATSVAEARWLEDRGADAVIAQGFEAGGHQGSFLPRDGADQTGTMALVPRVVDAVRVPVIAAGGIADGRGIAAAFMLGAEGVQIGTAFLVTPESMVPQVHKDALLAASGDDTMLSRAFSGKPARTITNAFAREMADVTDWPDFPLMNAATGPIRKASATVGLPDAVSLWSGQGAGLARAGTTGEVVERLVAEAQALLTK